MLMRASLKHIVRKGLCLKKALSFLLRGLAAGLVLYGHYTCGIYWNDADEWYYLLYGEHRVDGADA